MRSADHADETALTAFDDDDDREDWGLEILQALVAPSTVDEAALACAAAWVSFAGATHVSVAVFDATDSCVVAHGRRENGQPAVSVGRENCSFSLLLQPEGLFAPSGPCQISNPELILCWPEHFSVVLADVADSADSEERIDLVEKISRRLLARWTSPQTSFAHPGHMEAMAEFAAGAGHEINNPLGSIIGQTQLLLKAVERSDHRQALETIGAQAWRIRDMIGDTMLFARPPQPEFSHCDLIAIAQKVVNDQNAAFGAQKLVTLAEPESRVLTFADEAQIATLISHLVRNACEALREAESESPEVILEIWRESEYAAGISVTDNGPEIPAEIRRHLFDPFYSGRQAGRGLGFGLCHCWQIARMHNGVLTHERMSDGNRFIALLPLESVN